MKPAPFHLNNNILPARRSPDPDPDVTPRYHPSQRHTSPALVHTGSDCHSCCAGCDRRRGCVTARQERYGEVGRGAARPAA